METFLQGHDPQNGWNQTSQDELEALIQESVAEDKTEDLKLVVFASRTRKYPFSVVVESDATVRHCSSCKGRISFSLLAFQNSSMI